jgi:tetratricopeptide (TPR) repeat protein
MFYGRDALVAELTNLVVNNKHVALIGAGGIGKSSLAKAILNEPFITEKFGDRRFFVTYDGLDPSTITFEAFMTRFASTLGIELAGADPVAQICAFLRPTCALIVLDNAETFEEAGGSSALMKIPPAIATIADIPGVILMLTSRSRRNAPNMEWITKDVPSLDLTSAQVAFFQIYHRVSRSIAEEEITVLLEALEFHPLSINLLATAAEQNDWSPAMLLKRWNTRLSKVLDHGKGKLQSLSDTMSLSLGSPSIQGLGEDGPLALAVIAFLPQGLNEDLANDLLPSLPQVDAICDILCRQSLVYRQDGFIKMLAPIRHYVKDSLLPPNTNCLRDIYAFYYDNLRRCPEKRDKNADIIISDNANIEHMLAFDLARALHGAEEVYAMCWTFLGCLRTHLPRPTILAPLIFNIVENSSTWKLKAMCLSYLGFLYHTLSQLAEGTRAMQAAEALYLTAGDYETAAICTTSRAGTYIRQGRFVQTQQTLEAFQHSDSWEHLNHESKARVWFLLDTAQMSTFTAPAAQLFVKSMEDPSFGLSSKIRHWRAQLFCGGCTSQVKMHLEDLLLQCPYAESPYPHRDALLALAEVAYYEGRLSEVMDILQKIVEIFEGQDPEEALKHAVLKGAIASHQGHYDLAKKLILKPSGPSEFLALRSTHAFLHRSYVSACIELTAHQYDTAESDFTATIEGCDMQGDLCFKALSIRGLGEVAFAHDNVDLATKLFAETSSLCVEMGLCVSMLCGVGEVYDQDVEVTMIDHPGMRKH